MCCAKFTYCAIKITIFLSMGLLYFRSPNGASLIKPLVFRLASVIPLDIQYMTAIVIGQKDF